MTTTTSSTHDDRIREATEALDDLGVITPADLTTPFFTWVSGIHDHITYLVECVEFVQEIDADVRARTERLSATLDRAADIIETMARGVALPERSAAAGQAARILFESLTGGPELRMTLLGVDYGQPSECVLGLYS